MIQAGVSHATELIYNLRRRPPLGSYVVPNMRVVFPSKFLLYERLACANIYAYFTAILGRGLLQC